MISIRIIKRHGVPLNTALRTGIFIDALGKRRNEKAWHDKKLKALRADILWRTNWQAIVRRLSLEESSEGRLFAYGRPSASKPHRLQPDAKWDSASPYGGEHSHIRFENGPTIYDVMLLDLKRQKLLKKEQDLLFAQSLDGNVSLQSVSQVGRPTVRAQIFAQMQKRTADPTFAKLPMKKMAEILAKASGNELNSRNWNLRTVERHISAFLSARAKGL